MNKVATIIASYERPRLLQQTVETLQKNSEEEQQIIIVDDFSQNPDVLEYIQSLNGVVDWYRFPFRAPIHAVKNKGFLMIDDDVDYIHFSDNDVFYEPQWDSTMIGVMEQRPDIGILGGQHHPHHQIDSRERVGVDELIFSNTQAGYSMFIRRKDFVKIGPWFSELLAGGEDSNFCTMALDSGFKIASFNPPIVLHCGVTTMTGGMSAGSEHIVAMAKNREDIYVE